VKRYSGDKQSGARNSGDSWHVGCDVIYSGTLTGPELGRRLDAVAVERRNINYNTGGYEVTIKRGRDGRQGATQSPNLEMACRIR
jgi:hypothetical protein